MRLEAEASGPYTSDAHTGMATDVATREGDDRPHLLPTARSRLEVENTAAVLREWRWSIGAVLAVFAEGSPTKTICLDRMERKETRFFIHSYCVNRGGLLSAVLKGELFDTGVLASVDDIEVGSSTSNFLKEAAEETMVHHAQRGFLFMAISEE